MRRRTAAVSLAVIVAAAPAAAAATSASGAGVKAPGASLPGIGRLIPAHAGQVLPRHNETVDSLNWSGYAVTGKAITAVKSRFVVPTAGLVPPGFAASWAGIGGYDTNDLIQAGAAAQSTGLVGGSRYYAWYEILPAAETLLTGCSGDPACTVRPGDAITVDIHEISTNNWSVSLTNANHWTWSKTIHYVSTHSSAEWILEAPTVGVQTIIAPVGTAYFGGTSTYTAGGVTRTIAQGNPVRINLGIGPVLEAAPSNLAANGQSFNDCTYLNAYTGCPAPIAHRRR